MTQLAIKINSLETNFQCALCGQEEHANPGPQLFLEDSWKPTCRDCGDEHAPTLSALLDLAACAAALAGAGLSPAKTA